MKKYYIERQIVTLSNLLYFNQNSPQPENHFTIEWIDLLDSWTRKKNSNEHIRLASSSFNSNNYHDAVSKMKKKLLKIIPRLSYVWQTYINFMNESYLVHESLSPYIFLRPTYDIQWCSLTFDETRIRNLNKIVNKKNTKIGDEFYKYLLCITNCTDYSLRLMWLCAAIDSIKVEWDRRKDRITVLWWDRDLADKIFKKNDWLRHRMMHWEYLDSIDWTNDYVSILYWKLILYVEQEYGITFEKVVNPMRIPYWNKEGVISGIFLEIKNQSDVSLERAMGQQENLIQDHSLIMQLRKDY